MLHNRQGSILILFIAVVQDAASQKPISKQVNLVLYTNTQSWNDAQTICRAISGTLYTEDSNERTIVLRHYMDTDTYRSFEIWLGLHYLTQEGEHGWTNCESLTENPYTVWKNGNNPTDGASKQCVIVHDMADSHWHTKDCKDSKRFLCEVRGNDCTYTSLGNTKPNIAESLQLTESGIDSCKQACLTQIQNDKNCWALNWKPASSTNNCILYFVDDPFQVTASSVTADSDQELLIKECYGFEVSNDNSPSSDTSSTPNSGCDSFDTTTTSTTTTSTSTTPTTTTTTVTSTTSSTTSTTTSPTTSTTTTPTTTTPTTTTTTPITSTTTTSTTSTTTTPTTTTTTTPTTSTTTSPITSTSTSTSTTSITTSTGQISLSNVSENSSCNCSCSPPRGLISALVLSPAFQNLTLEQKVEILQLRLKLDKNQLSSTIRKKTSATDNRTETKAVGSIGVTFLCVIFLPIIVSDAVKALVFLYKCLKQNLTSMDWT